jgi:hypothetical protein
MHPHHQAKVQDFRGQTDYPKILINMALQNGKLLSWQKGELLEYCHLIANPKTRATWTQSYGNELGGLAKGMPGQVTGMDTIFFIPKDKVPRARAKDVTYGLITCLIRPEETNEPNRTRLVAGGDRVHYPFDAGTLTTKLLTPKLLINSVISTPGARFFTMDIKNFYLCTPMTR